MRWMVSSKQGPVHYLCIYTTVFLALCSAPVKAVVDTLVNISYCIPTNSTLALTANCECHRGGRGGANGRSCGQSDVELIDLVCTRVLSIGNVGGMYRQITCLEINDSPELTELTLDELKQFPNLEGLIIDNTGLEKITENLSLAIPYIYELHVDNNQLREIPKLGSLKNLTRVSFARNMIQAVDRSQFSGAERISMLDLSGNQLTVLTGKLFDGLCKMRRLFLSDNNNLRKIEDSVFDNVSIERLDLSNTSISVMPYTSNLGGWLTVLDLRGTENLHTFNSHREGGRLRDQAFWVLRNVSFHYHAHCCQLKRSNYSYYEPDLSMIVDKKRETSSQNIFQKLYDYFIGGSYFPSPVDPDGYIKDRYARQTIPDENATVDSLSCLNYTDLNLVLFPPTTETPGTGEMNNDSGPPEGWFFHPNLTDLICTDEEIVNITTHVYRPCADESLSSIVPSHTVSTLPTPSPTLTALQTDTMPTPSSVPTMFPSETSSSVTAACSSTIEVFCMLTTTPPPTMITPPPTSSPCNCGTFGPFAGLCEFCVNSRCEDSQICANYQQLCDLNCLSVKRRRRYTIIDEEEEARMKRDASDALLPNGWFYPNPNNISLICIPTNESIPTDLPTTTTPKSSTSTTALPTIATLPSTGDQTCQTGPLFLDGTFTLLEFPTFCLPLEDPFNPCEDLLGEDNVLRSFIWIVIILALIGNSLVIIVFLGYTVITKRTKVELFVVHFFYFNLAIADFLMGIYLFTIAVQDLRTLGNFSMFDIAWRTEGGCAFSGFCAITSTMVSVYVLLAITVERLYTFSRALQKSHTSKTTGIILMAVGWAFGILMGILPIVGVSDYTKTAICLPFDVSSTPLALPYVLFLLLFTGIVFTAIAICHAIRFYYRQKATINSVSDRRRWKTELKVALRMGILVLSNFVCWFPIALLGISAAVGNSLVNNITFAKWVMVFIFPINACLNPILYSALSKEFRDNLVLIFGKCGLCRRQVSNIKRHRAGFTPSIISTRSQVSSKAGLTSTSESRRGTIIEQFRNFSITSTTNLLGRRSSTLSQTSSEEHYQIELIRTQRRQSSEYSSASSEDILGVKVNSRRGSAFSSGSMEEMTTFSNPGFCSSSPVGGSISVADGVGNHKGSPRPRISLGAVPEENENSLSEIAIAPEPSGEGKQNLANLENETEIALHGNGIIISMSLSQVVNHYRITDLESEKGSGPVEKDESSVTTDSAASIDTQEADHEVSVIPIY